MEGLFNVLRNALVAPLGQEWQNQNKHVMDYETDLMYFVKICKEKIRYDVELITNTTQIR